MNELDYTNYLLPGGIVLFVGLAGVYFAYLFNRLARFGNAAEANIGQVRVALRRGWT